MNNVRRQAFYKSLKMNFVLTGKQAEKYTNITE